jgi:hypothetical protein
MPCPPCLHRHGLPYGGGKRQRTTTTSFTKRSIFFIDFFNTMLTFLTHVRLFLTNGTYFTKPLEAQRF